MSTPALHQLRLPGREWTNCTAAVAREQAALGVETRALVDQREVERLDKAAQRMVGAVVSAVVANMSEESCEALGERAADLMNARAALTQEPAP